MASLKDEIGDFVGIPHSFIEDDQQTAESRVVFMILRYHTNRKRKRSFPGYETIMRETGLKRNKTAEGLGVLEKTGWLVKHRQFGRAMEYELRYPARHDSPAGKLSQGTAIVSQVTDDSPAGNRCSNSDNEIEFNKIDSPLPKHYKEIRKPPAPRTLYPPADFPITEAMYLWLAEMCFAFTESELIEATSAWRDSRGSKPSHFMRTLTMWQCDWKKFIRIYWDIRQQRKNGNGHEKPDETRWMNIHG